MIGTDCSEDQFRDDVADVKRLVCHHIHQSFSGGQLLGKFKVRCVVVWFSARLLELLNFLEIEGKRLIRFVGYELLKFSKRREEKKEEEELGAGQKNNDVKIAIFLSFSISNFKICKEII